MIVKWTVKIKNEARLVGSHCLSHHSWLPSLSQSSLLRRTRLKKKLLEERCIYIERSPQLINANSHKFNSDCALVQCVP